MTARAGATRRPRVLWIAAEAAPWAVVGGLGEVVGSLAPRLAAAGADLTLLLPAYRGLRRDPGAPAVRERRPLALRLGRRTLAAEILVASGAGGLPLRLLACDELYGREGIYGEGGGEHADNAVRFGALCAAALELARDEGFTLLHGHDWPAALVPVMLATRHAGEPELERVRVLLTLHNALYQGIVGPEALADLGLPSGLFHPQLMEHHGRVNLLKGGIVFADALSTVSARYARELGRDAAGGLAALVRERAGDLVAIRNGIDVERWDPARDPHLAAAYSSTDPRGKARCKAALQAELGLPVKPRTPLAGFLGRLVEQKGIDLLLEALPALRRSALQVVIVGRGDPDLEARVRTAAAAEPERVAAVVAYDEPLAHRLLAGCDLALVPSRYEPCGLVQMQAMRYGAVPVAHAVGGLADTIRPATAAGIARGTSTGVLFQTPSAAALARAVGRALTLYRDAAAWKALQRAAMTADFSWDAAVGRYLDLYRAVARRPARRIAVAAVHQPPPAEPVAPPAEGPPAEPYIDWGPELPARYGEDRLALLVQSPRSLYVYWEVAPATYAAAGGEPRLRLRLRAPEGPRELWAEAGDLGEYWLRAEPDRAYTVELLAPDGRTLLVSAPARTPREEPSPRTDVRWVHRGRRRDGLPATGFDQAAADEERLPLYAFDLQQPVGRFGPSPWQAAAAAAEGEAARGGQGGEAGTETAAGESGAGLPFAGSSEHRPAKRPEPA